MKKVIILICSLLVVFSLTACNANNTTENTNNSSNTETTVEGAKYVGIWKAKALQFNSASATEYRTSVIELLADGSGKYEDRAITWKYNADIETISFTVVGSNAASLIVSQKDGKDVLLYNVSVTSENKYNRTYYRENEYIEDNTPDSH